MRLKVYMTSIFLMKFDECIILSTLFPFALTLRGCLCTYWMVLLMRSRVSLEKCVDIFTECKTICEKYLHLQSASIFFQNSKSLMIMKGCRLDSNTGSADFLFWFNIGFNNNKSYILIFIEVGEQFRFRRSSACFV